jgi:hypothetical protein
MQQTQISTKGLYRFRLFALACATVSGVYFLGSAFVLAATFNHTERHFPLFITGQDFAKTMVAGVCFLFSGIAFVVLGRKTKSKSAVCSPHE